MALKTGFGWKDIDAVIYGNIPVFISEIRYKVIKEKNNRMGRGSKAVGRTRGNESYEVTVVLGIEETKRIEQAIRAKYGAGFKPTDLEATDISISYDNGTDFALDVVRDWEPTEWGGGAAQGDMNIDISIPGIAGDIDFSTPI